MFVFRVQQTAMVCEHTMEQQSFLVQSMPSGVNTKHALLKIACTALCLQTCSSQQQPPGYDLQCSLCHEEEGSQVPAIY